MVGPACVGVHQLDRVTDTVALEQRLQVMIATQVHEILGDLCPLTAGGTTSAQIVTAAALGSAGRQAEALDIFRSLETEPDLDLDLVGQAVTEHAMYLLMHCGEPLAALARLQTGLDRCGPGHDATIRSTLSTVLFFAGEVEAAVATAAPLLKRPGRFPPSAGPALASGWAATGNPTGVLETWDRVRSSLTRDDPDHSSFVGLNLIGCRLLALLQLGRAPEGDDPLAALPSDTWWPMRDSWVVQQSLPATQAFLRGHLDVAAERFEELTPLLHCGPLQISVHTEAIIAALHAQRGDADRHGPEMFYVTTSLHDVVRLGRAPLVVERLTAMAGRRGATWLDETYAAHAVAAADGDANALLAVSERFEAGGLDLDAMEAAALATTSAVHRPGLSSSARSRMERLAMLCGTVRTPAMEVRPPWLTDREVEVSRLAARGWTNAKIADQLGTSRRTVGNQLQSAYQKLGINSQDELLPLFPAGLNLVDARTG